MKYPYHPIGSDDAMFVVEWLAIHISLISSLFNKLPVIGMDEFYEFLVCYIELLWSETADTVCFIRPGHSICKNIPLPAANMGYMLCLRKLPLTFYEFFLRPAGLGNLAFDPESRQDGDYKGQNP